jgi:DNA-binding NarL/FixJ family response regulator
MRRLVVVAQDSLIVEAIAIGLRRSGEFRMLDDCIECTGGVETIMESEPDVVLLDDMDCLDHAAELVRQIKAEHERVTVIVLTLSMESDRLDAIFDAGAAGAISKATHPTALPALVRATINGHLIHVYPSSSSASVHPETSAETAPAPLTTRELEILRLVAAGSTNREIGQKLWVTEQTVKFHLSNVYRKLGVGNRTEASRYAHVNGLVTTADPGGAY